ncbi:hypothetical protein FHR83_001946 [Actinoplanes campanulatus]|uniref:Uncharacterized protein n=1 Tax=Actinoplanes campanulatus TaxID=113559 RepID=A0A7W5AE42_9ACTN|nr:hypothetical protein [Actinoplanes campanulatus]MBB3094294.1 hypothetical protein [Actinoplanes campanulatus]GGN20006.1 hypothetical protein GCM10010109_33620 [Actinoplanes campanulatus]GID35787.1 hypothetical protein Aca09nite_22930 [Actinoplanes campanulatus]
MNDAPAVASSAPSAAPTTAPASPSATGLRGRPPREGAAIAIRLATLPDGGPTGSFFNDAGVIPW